MILRHVMLDLPPQESNLWMMIEEGSGRAVLVDAGAFAAELDAELRALGGRLEAIWITHLHWDHVDGLAGWMKAWPEAAELAPASLAAAPAARIVDDGDEITAGPWRARIFRTSGHTPEAVSYYVESERICFTGDALFAGSVGGTADDARHTEQIEHLRRTVMALPPETELLPGHGPATTVEIERAGNPFLQAGFGRTG